MSTQNTVRAEGVVAHLEGKAWVRLADGGLREIHVGDKIAEGAVLVTADNSLIELRAVNGASVTIGGGREVLADAGLLTQEVPAHDEAAVAKPNGADIERVVQALQSGADPFDALDPAAAGLAGGEANESHSFVRLLRIVEGLDPLVLPNAAGSGGELGGILPVDDGGANVLALAPTINADRVNTDQDTQAGATTSGGVLNNDVEPNAADHLAVVAIQAGSGQAQPVSAVGTTVEGGYGTLTIHADGSYSYSPNEGAKSLGAGETGVDTFTYTAANSQGGSGSATLSINVSGTNDAPVARADTQDATQDATVNVDAARGVLVNDSDPDARDMLQVVGVAAAGGTPSGGVGSAIEGAYGHLTLNADGAYTYVADKSQALGAGVTAQDAFTYEVSDGHGGTSTATLTLTVTGLHAAPTLNADTAGTDQDTTIARTASTGVLSNDVEPNLGDHLSVSAIQGSGAQQAVSGGTEVGGAYGTLTINPDGAYRYTPNAAAKALGVGESVVDTFIYTATDAHGYTRTATLNIKVDGLNDAPTAQADAGVVNQGATLNENVLPNDSDPDVRDALSVVGVAAGTGVPSGGVGAAIAGVYGHLTLRSDGSYTYTADNAAGLGAGVTAQDTFSYQISDGHGGTSTTTLSLTVNGLQAAPTLTGDNGSTDQDTALTVPLAGGVLANDTDPNIGEHLSVTGIQAGSGPSSVVTAAGTTVVGAYGSLTIHADGAYTYTPNAAAKTLGAGESAVDSFTYTAADALGGGGTATLSISVAGLNDAPTATLDGQIVSQGNTVTVNGAQGVLANDTDPDALDALSVIGVMAGSGVPSGGAGTAIAGAYGHLTLNDDGSYSYVADNAASLGAGTSAQDSFTYQISDRHGGLSTATLTLTVNGLMAQPTLAGDLGNTDQDTTLTVPLAGGVLANDTDPNIGDHLSVTAIQAGSGVGLNVVGATTMVGAYGALTINPDGSYTYTPNAAAKALGVGESATDSFTYTATDAHGGTGTAKLDIRVGGLNDAPTAVLDSGSVSQNATRVADVANGVLVNDTDPDTLDALSVIGVMAGNGVPSGGVGTAIAGAYGHLTLNGDGSYTYVADKASGLDAAATVQDRFTYQISDGHGGTSTSTLTLSVGGTNDTPNANPDTNAVSQDATVTATAAQGVLINDTDPDTGDTLSVVGLVAGNNAPIAANLGTAIAGTYGHLTLNTDGSYTYVADNAKALGATASVQDVFTYQVSDGHGGTSNASLTLTVNGLNDAPTAKIDSNFVTQDATATTTAAQGVLVNDTDPDAGDTLSVIGAVAGNNTPLASNLGTSIAGTYGHLTLNANGSYTYVADNAKMLGADSAGQDIFTYQISDGHGGTSTSTLTLSALGINDAPVAQATTATGYEHPATPIAVTLTGTDVDGAVTGFKVTSLPTNGTLYLDAAHTTPVTVGTLIPASGSTQLYFMPTGNWSGSTSFNYVAHDNSHTDSTAPATATLNVIALNDAPIPTLAVAALDRWTFNEASGGSTANAYGAQTGTLGDVNLSAGGTVPTWVTGHDGLSATALSFDGKGGYVALSSTATAALNTTATLSMWVNTTQTGANSTRSGWSNPSIIGTEEYGGGRDIQWGAISNTGKIGLGYGNVNGLYSAATINDGIWHQVVITRTLDTTTGKAAVTIYVDGTLSASGTLTQDGSMANGVVPNHFAGFGLTNGWQGTTDATTGDVYYKGSLDSARIYDHALTSDQARAVYLVENGFSNLAVANDGDAVKLNITLDSATALTVTGLEAGMIISDGTHTATSTGNAATIDLTGWTVSALQLSGLGAGASATLAFDAANTVAGQTHDVTSYLNIVSGTSLVGAGNGNVTVTAPDQASLVVGGTGNQTLNGGAGNDRLIAGTGTNVLNGGAGNDVLIAGHGSATMTGGLGNDVFRFELGSHGTVGSPNVTTIADFNTAAGSKDVLDMRDLLQGDSHNGTTPGNLSSYLHVTQSGADTVIEISSTGGFSGGYSASAVDQKIVLQNVDLTNGGALTTDNQIIIDLLTKGMLHAD